MSIDQANRVYDLLVSIGGAAESERHDFIYYHTNHKESKHCQEWRFCGKLGFGGKYRSGTNSVDCYSEDENPLRLKIMAEINSKLKYL